MTATLTITVPLDSDEPVALPWRLDVVRVASAAFDWPDLHLGHLDGMVVRRGSDAPAPAWWRPRWTELRRKVVQGPPGWGLMIVSGSVVEDAPWPASPRATERVRGAVASAPAIISAFLDFDPNEVFPRLYPIVLDTAGVGPGLGLRFGPRAARAAWKPLAGLDGALRAAPAGRLGALRATAARPTAVPAVRHPAVAGPSLQVTQYLNDPTSDPEGPPRIFAHIEDGGRPLGRIDAHLILGPESRTTWWELDGYGQELEAALEAGDRPGDLRMRDILVHLQVAELTAEAYARGLDGLALRAMGLLGEGMQGYAVVDTDLFTARKRYPQTLRATARLGDPGGFTARGGNPRFLWRDLSAQSASAIQ